MDWESFQGSKGQMGQITQGKKSTLDEGKQGLKFEECWILSMILFPHFLQDKYILQ